MGAVGEASRRPPAPRPAPVSRAPAAPDFVREIGGMVALPGRRAPLGDAALLAGRAEFVAQFRFTLKVCFFPLILTSFALSFGPAGRPGVGLLRPVRRIRSHGRRVRDHRRARLRADGRRRSSSRAPRAPRSVPTSARAWCARRSPRCACSASTRSRASSCRGCWRSWSPRSSSTSSRCWRACSGSCSSWSRTAARWARLLDVLRQRQPARAEAATVKAGVYGAVIAIVCCYKGLTVSGGAQGVGRAVNQAVVICFLAIGFIDYVFTQLLLATPRASRRCADEHAARAAVDAHGLRDVRRGRPTSSGASREAAQRTRARATSSRSCARRPSSPPDRCSSCWRWSSPSG